jgi:hypothetical protein
MTDVSFTLKIMAYQEVKQNCRTFQELRLSIPSSDVDDICAE